MLSKLFVLAALATAAAAGASSSEEDITAQEAEIAQHVSLPAFHAKMAELDKKMRAKLAGSEDLERKSMLAERLEEIAQHGYVAPLTGDDLEETNDRSRLIGDFYEGDIILSQEQLDALDVIDPRNASTRARRQAWKPQRFPSNIWGANQPIPFSFHEKYPAESIPSIREALKFWQDNTCIRFKEGAAGSARIKFINGAGCYSLVGKQGNEQPVSIGGGCETVGIVTHELGHTLGLYHTQSREDRDRYVIVNSDNIENGVANNFDKGPQGELDNFGVPYEYGSNMHYHPFSFAKDRAVPTLVAVDKAYQYSMAGVLPTFYDILLVNKYYGCFDAMCKGVSVSCQNGGVQDVNNCRACKCPTGYSGTDCSQTDSKYKVIKSQSSPQQQSTTVGIDKWDMADKASYEYFLIEAPAGKRVEVTFDLPSLRIPYPTEDCLFGGVEIFTKKDTRMAGFKFCQKEQAAKSYLSDGERVFLKIWNQFATADVKFTHRAG